MSSAQHQHQGASHLEVQLYAALFMPMTPQARRAPEQTASVRAPQLDDVGALTSVAGGLARLALRAGLRVVALAQVILQLVHDHGATNNRVGA